MGASYSLKKAHWLVDHEDNSEKPKVLEAITCLKMYGVEAKSEHFDLYRKLASHALSLTQQESTTVGTQALVDTRDFLYALCAEMVHQRMSAAGEFMRLFQAVHWSLLKERAAKD